MRAFLFASVALLATSIPLRAQADLPLSCRDAAAQVQGETVRGRARDRALDRLGGCGDVASPAIASAIRRERGSTDTQLLLRLNSHLHGSSGGGMLDAVVSVAQDASASKEARVTALLALVKERHPRMVTDYQHVAGGLDQYGMPRNGCFAGRIADDPGPSQMSRGDVERILAMARTLSRDKTQPADVRSAARCVLP